jgi:SPX domain protein involved in polyphosphate accumulation
VGPFVFFTRSQYNYDGLIVKLSRLFDLVRTRGHPIEGDSAAGGTQNAFVRSTTKYWVSSEPLQGRFETGGRESKESSFQFLFDGEFGGARFTRTTLCISSWPSSSSFPCWVSPLGAFVLERKKLTCALHTVFNPSKEFEVKDSAITSIYFDNEGLELYLGRLEKTEGAEAIRLRWYGDVSNKTVSATSRTCSYGRHLLITPCSQIFVERKTHREDWTGEKSVKARFAIAEHKANDFIAGRLTMDDEFDELVKRGKKTVKEVDSMKQLANEVQYAILTRGLKPGESRGLRWISVGRWE